MRRRLLPGATFSFRRPKHDVVSTNQVYCIPIGKHGDKEDDRSSTSSFSGAIVSEGRNPGVIC
jgi:hypothetical protein